MAVQIHSLLDRLRPNQDWSQKELAEFYRVEASLINAGLSLESERGLTDEDDPWFAFCRHDTGEAFIHFARIAGEYWVVTPTAPIIRGRDFTKLVRNLLEVLPLEAVSKRRGSNITLHPAVALLALVGAAFFHTGAAKAADTRGKANDQSRRAFTLPASGSGSSNQAAQIVLADRDTAQAAALASILIALVQGNYSNHLQRESASESHLPALDFGNLMLIPYQAPRLDTLAHVVADLAAAPTIVFESLAARLLSFMDQAAPLTGVVASFATVPASNLAPLVTAPSPAPFALAGADHAGLTKDHASLPNTEASEVILDSGVLAKAGLLLHLDHLPADLASLLILGAQIDGGHYGSSATTQIPPSAAPSTPVAASTNVVVVDPSVPTGVAVVSTTSTSVVSDSHGTGSTPSAPAETQASPSVQSAHDAAIDAVVAQFVAHVTDLDTIVSSHQVVLYDGQIYTPGAPAGALGSVTFTFDDGSSVSLVGTLSELIASHAVH